MSDKMISVKEFCVRIIVINLLVLYTLCLSPRQHLLPYTFYPESREMEVYENDMFIIKFLEKDITTRFTHCYVSTKTFHGDYELDGREREFKEVPYKLVSLLAQCGFSIEATPKTPSKWTVIAFDPKLKKNYTETVHVQFYYNAFLYTTEISVLPNGAGFTYFEFPPNVNITSCMITLGDVNEATMDEYFRMTFPIKTSMVTVRNFGRDKCGVVVGVDGILDDTYSIGLTAKDEHHKLYKSYIDIQTVSIDFESFNQTEYVFLGDPATIQCGKNSTQALDSYESYCYLYNPEGELVSSDEICHYSLEMVTEMDLGLWQCSIYFQFLMESYEFYTNLMEKEEERVEVIMNPNKKAKYALIGCQLRNFANSSLDYCNFIRPDGKRFRVQKEAAISSNLRYTSVTADLERGFCGIETPFEFEPEEEGIWKCELHSANFTTGGFIHAYNDFETPMKIKNNIQLPTFKNAIVKLNDAFDIACFVPFSAKACYILAPNGTQYIPEDKYQVFLGECSLKVQNASSSDNGTWSCYFSRGQPHVVDEKIQIDVIVVEANMMRNQLVKAYEWGSAYLFCNVKNIPIKFCRFQSPLNNKTSYTFYDRIVEEEEMYGEHKKTVFITTSNDTNINYEGRGLRKGDCGIKIQYVRHEHMGQWTCQVRIGQSRDNLIISQHIKLDIADELSGWAYFGIICGVSIFIGFLIFILRKTKPMVSLQALFKRKPKGREFELESLTTTNSPSDTPASASSPTELDLSVDVEGPSTSQAATKDDAQARKKSLTKKQKKRRY